jgi:hypothetical protein
MIVSLSKIVLVNGERFDKFLLRLVLVLLLVAILIDHKFKVEGGFGLPCNSQSCCQEGVPGIFPVILDVKPNSIESINNNGIPSSATHTDSRTLQEYRRWWMISKQMIVSNCGGLDWIN